MFKYILYLYTLLADATPSPTFIAVQKRNFINIEALSIAGIWVGTVVLVGAAVLILIELIKCNRREKNVQFKRYTFNIDAINRGLFEEEIDL